MLTYADGTEVQLGDYVVGTPFNTHKEVAGVIIVVKEAMISIAFFEFNKEYGTVEILYDTAGNSETHFGLKACYDHGDPALFRKVGSHSLMMM